MYEVPNKECTKCIKILYQTLTMSQLFPATIQFLNHCFEAYLSEQAATGKNCGKLLG